MDMMPLYAEFDPKRPLGADEEDLYVDWQNELDLGEDVKSRLVNSISRSSGAACWLFTGHGGAGKTTELHRVKRRIEEAAAGRRMFVSMWKPEQPIDLGTLQPEDIIFHIARQLVTDLDAAGFTAAGTSFRRWYDRLLSLLRREVEISGVEIGADPLKLTLALGQFPAAQQEFRRILEGQLPTLYDLINEDIIGKSLAWLADPPNGGYDDILIIVDDLEKITPKVLDASTGLTNHEAIFLHRAETLRALSCDVVYTIPLELAYSRSHALLQDAYGCDILSIATIPVAHRGGADYQPGLAVLREIVARRTARAGLALEDVFPSEPTLTEVLRRSGGHIRGLFILLRSLLDRTDILPIDEAVVERSLRRIGQNWTIALRPADWKRINEVNVTKEPPDSTDSDAWNRLLRDRFVLTYQDYEGYWYDVHPLLHLVWRAAS